MKYRSDPKLDLVAGLFYAGIIVVIVVVGLISTVRQIEMKDKIKQAVADEFKYRARQGRTQYSMEEVLYIVNEVIDEVNFEENKVMPQAQFIDVGQQI